MKTVGTEKRTIFIGDVHGCIDELKEMIHTLRPVESDRVILLGDLINRGPDPAAVVQFVYESKFECLMGNHEHEYLHYFQTVDKYKNLRRSIGEELHEWISNRPLYIEDKDFMAVHAGLVPGEHPSRSKKEILLNIRTWDADTKNIKNPENPPWYSFYKDKKPVFYGHWAREGLNVRKNTIGLDSGCVYGRGLSAYILESHEIVQINSRKVHYIPPSLREQKKTNLIT
ncbi:MAG: metallophosphoesterase [Spirochaetia bacterium]|nr:metallophosphoesterase [Spirochaetia bacterium]